MKRSSWKMLKSGLIDSVVSVFSLRDFQVVDCRGSRSSFDVIARDSGSVFLVKVLSNIEGLSRSAVNELKQVAELLGATPLIVGERMKNSGLNEGVVYDRYGVHCMNPQTLSQALSDDGPRVFSTRGNYYVRVDRNMLAQARHRMGLTQEALADSIGVSKQSVYRYERQGRMSASVFGRLVELLGSDLADEGFALSYEGCSSSPGYRGKVTSLKERVYRDLARLGFETSMTNAPFDILAERDRRLLSVVSNDYRRLSDKVTVLEKVSRLIGGYTVCISQRKVEVETSVLTPEELKEVESRKELFKILKDNT